jgi:surface protein
MDRMFYASKFNGDISTWNVSSVYDMTGMFAHSLFNGDISQWDVSNVTTMSLMFLHSSFQGDLALWNTSKVTNMYAMFQHSLFNGDLSRWDVSNVLTLMEMFEQSAFQGDLQQWRVRSNTTVGNMIDPTSNIKIPDSLLSRIQDIFPAVREQQSYLSTHLLPLLPVHVLRAMATKTKPPYLHKDIFQRIKQYQEAGILLGLSGQDLLMTVYQQARLNIVEHIAPDIDFSL